MINRLLSYFTHGVENVGSDDKLKVVFHSLSLQQYNLTFNTFIHQQTNPHKTKFLAGAWHTVGGMGGISPDDEFLPEEGIR